MPNGGPVTTYTYGADGTRLLRRVETTAGSEVTAYAGPVEVRNFGTPSERIIRQLRPNVRQTGKTAATATKSVLHRNHLGSVMYITTDGLRSRRVAHHTYGARAGGYINDPSVRLEDEGFIGEQHDEDAGLIYLNARYYDPDLGRFIQPDWWEVTIPGVGTNRYAYSFNDPVNNLDPGWNMFGMSDEEWESNKQFNREGRTNSDEMGFHDFHNDRMSGERSGKSGSTGGYSCSVCNGDLVWIDRTGQTRDLNDFFDDSDGDGIRDYFDPDADINFIIGMDPMSDRLGFGRAARVTPDQRKELFRRNALRGKAAEAQAQRVFGPSIRGSQVTFVTSTGIRARVDFVTKGGVLEVKSGNARLSRGQRQLLDDVVNGRSVVPVGANARLAGYEPGARTTIPAFTVTHPSLMGHR